MPGVSTMTTNQGRKRWSLSTSLTSWIPKLRVPTTSTRSTQMERLNYNWLMTSLSESTLEESSLTESKRFSLSFPLSMNSCQFVGKLKMCIMWCLWSRVSSSHWLSSNHRSMSRQGLTKVSDSTTLIDLGGAECSATLMEPLCYNIDIDQLCIPQQCVYQCGSKIEMTLWGNRIQWTGQGINYQSIEL